MTAPVIDTGYINSLLEEGEHQQGIARPAGDQLSKTYELEQAVLCSILTLGYITTDITEAIGPEDIGTPAHRKIYSVCLALHLQGKQIDLLSVMTELDDKLKSVGGAGYLTELSGLPFFSRNAGLAAQAIREDSDRRKIAAVMSQAQEWIQDGVPADEIRDFLRRGIEAKTRRKNSPPAMSDLIIKPEEMTAARLTPVCIVQSQ